MMRFLVVLVCVLGASVAGAQEKDVPLAEIDKWYAAEGAKERDAQITERQETLAKLNASISAMIKKKADAMQLERAREGRDSVEADIDGLMSQVAVAPRLDPLKLAVGQAGIVYGAGKYRPAVAKVKKLLNDNDVLVRLENTDVEIVVKCEPDSVEIGDRLPINSVLQVVGKRSINGKDYLYLRLYTPPDQRKP